MKIISLLIGCCLLMGFTSYVQSTEINVVDQISFVAGDTVNLTVTAISDTTTTICLIIKILPDDEGFNLTYPKTLNLTANQKQSFNITIRTLIQLAPDDYNITLKYLEISFEEPPENGGDSSPPKKPRYFVIGEFDEDDAIYPIIHPKPDKPNVIFDISSDDESQNAGCFLFLIIGIIAVIITILYLLVRKGTKAKKPGEKEK